MPKESINLSKNAQCEITGFAIGGVALIGHKQKIDQIFIDEDLLKHEILWAAAGHKELLESIERGEWRSVKNAKKEAAFAKKAAANSLRKDERVTLRLSSIDLDRLKQKAAFKGLPYQTFIASVLHEYAAGHFKEIGKY